MNGWRHQMWPAGGPLAADAGDLLWIMVVVCTLVFAAVVVAFVLAVRHGRAGDRQTTSASSLTRSVGIATGTTAVILVGLLVASASVGRALDDVHPADPLAVTVTGQQWWWRVEYPSSQPSLQVTTANEIHLPVGRPVLLRLSSVDVIHSFWIPNLQGKMDLVPGRTNAMWLQADTPGIYYGQCAEFCGAQHAHMALLVVAESPEEFAAWLDRERAAAPEPATDEARRGRTVVEEGTCALCHAVRGTSAGARMGPDLTHLMSRQTLAAGALPNTPGTLMAWLSAPQRIKPGSKMPNPGLSAGELRDVAAYLETLR